MLMVVSYLILPLLLYPSHIGAPRPGYYESPGILDTEEPSLSQYSVHAAGHFTTARSQRRDDKDELKYVGVGREAQTERGGVALHSTDGFAALHEQHAWDTAISMLEMEESQLDKEEAPKGGKKGPDGYGLDKQTDEVAMEKQKCGKDSEAHSVIETNPLIGGPFINQCPTACAYAAESKTAHCHFRCVSNTSCGQLNTIEEANIPDEKHKICRRCDVEGCLTCSSREKGNKKREETCEKCMPGYYLAGEGTECRSWMIWFFLGIIAIIVIGVLLGATWYFALLAKPIVNEEGVRYGLECRSRSRVRQPQGTVPSDDPSQGIGPRLLYPFDTNLCTTNVAGPGNMLFFRYQAAGIVWSVTLLAVWIGLVLSADPNIFRVGLRKASTPQMMCYVVNWGRHMQMKYIWVKVYWLIFAYTFSFLGSLWYAVNSTRLFQELDNQFTTMADFVAICRCVPIMNGDTKVEDCIKECIEKELGEEVVGVSVCWDFHDEVHAVKEALEEDVGSLEHAKATNSRHDHPPPPAQSAHADGEEQLTCIAAWAQSINDKVLGKWHCHLHDEHHEAESHEDKEKKVVTMLREMKTTECAFAVFHNEDSRDRALEKAKSRAIALGDSGFFLEPELHEPESCCWQDFAVTEAQLFWRVFRGCFYMLMALVLWTVVLYIPYAHYMASFSFANGDEPGEMSEMLFVSLVVGAQFGLFITANVVSHAAGFCFEDDKQCCYIILYNTALILNLVMDMSLAAFLAYHQMCGRGVRVADGRLLSELTSLQEILESFPMQKAIGNNLFKYCWPATFLLPFACEPFACQIGPYHIGCLLTRSNKKVTGENAEKALELSEPEQGRYADVIFNAILVSAIPFVAPGYMLTLFLALIVSHLYIYWYDHWRVLRCCTRFWFASDTVSMFGQKLFTIPCAILAAALVFKANQMSAPQHKDAAGHITVALGSGALKGPALWGTMAGVFFGHILIHWLCLQFLCPWLGRTDSKNAEETYEQCAARTPATWFSSNPVHCLRSKHIYKHDPPQTFYVNGKEHLIKKNVAIHSYFEEDAPRDKAEEQIRSEWEGGMTITKEDGWGAGGL